MKQFETEFIDFVASVWQSFGLDPLSSRLVGIIFIEPEEIPMENLAEKTGYSLASLSNKLRALEAMKVIKKVKKPGTKKSFYYIEKDVYQIMRRKLQATFDQFINPAKTALPNIINRHKGTKMSQEDKKKMDIIINYHKQLLDVSKCMEQHLRELEKL